MSDVNFILMAYRPEAADGSGDPMDGVELLAVASTEADLHEEIDRYQMSGARDWKYYIEPITDRQRI